MQAGQYNSGYYQLPNGQSIKPDPEKPVDLLSINTQPPSQPLSSTQPLPLILPDVHLDGPSGEKLKEILAQNGYRFEVTPGQRKYGGPPPGWQGGPLSPGHELFIGGVPKTCYEDKLIPLFKQFGQIWEVRLMTNHNSKEHKGYCFVSYCDKNVAKNARKSLDNYEVLPNRRIQANMNQANSRIFVGNVPKSKTQQEILHEFSRLTDGLRDVIVYKNAMEPLKNNRGFAFLDYDSHMNAKVAFKKLGSTGVTAFNRTLIVSWAEAQEEPDDEIMAQVKALYIRGLTSDVTEQMIKDMFGAYGVITNVRKIKDYAFVHFDQRDAALQAMNDLDSQRLGNSTMQITLAKPLTNKRDDKKGPAKAKGPGAAGRGAPRLHPPPHPSKHPHAEPYLPPGPRARAPLPLRRGRPVYDDDPHYPDEYDLYPPPSRRYLDPYDPPYERLPPPPRMRRRYEFDDYDYLPPRHSRQRSPPPEWDLRRDPAGRRGYDPEPRRPLPPPSYRDDPYRPAHRESVYGRHPEPEPAYQNDEFVIGNSLFEERMPQSARQIPAAQPLPPRQPVGPPRAPRPATAWRPGSQPVDHSQHAPEDGQPPREMPSADYAAGYQQPTKRPPPPAPPVEVKKPRLEPWQQSGGAQAWAPQPPPTNPAPVAPSSQPWVGNSKAAPAAAPPAPPPAAPPSAAAPRPTPPVVTYPDSSRENTWSGNYAPPAPGYAPPDNYNYGPSAQPPRPPVDSYPGYPPEHTSRARRY